MELRRLIGEYNTYVERIHPHVIARIHNSLASVGLGYTFASTTDYIAYVNNIYQLIKEHIIKRAVENNDDLSKAIQEFDMSKAIFSMAEWWNEGARDAILNNIKKDTILRNHLETVRTRRIEIQTQLTKMVNMVSPISRRIQRKAYNTKRRCCPTFWSLLDDYLT